MIYRAVNASINRTSQVKFSSERFTGSKLKRTYRLSCGNKDVYTGTEFCTGTTLFRKYHDGICGTYDLVQETNSTTCGYVAPPSFPPSFPPTFTPVCTPGLECVNDACAYCAPGSGSCSPLGYSCCSTYGQLNADCSRNVQCGNCCPGSSFANPGC